MAPSQCVYEAERVNHNARDEFSHRMVVNRLAHSSIAAEKGRFAA
jgi:hypothetical protein